MHPTLQKRGGSALPSGEREGIQTVMSSNFFFFLVVSLRLIRSQTKKEELRAEWVFWAAGAVGAVMTTSLGFLFMCNFIIIFLFCFVALMTFTRCLLSRMGS